MQMGQDTLLFALLVMLFGGFVQLADSPFLGADGGLYLMLVALVVGLVGFWQAARERVRE